MAPSYGRGSSATSRRQFTFYHSVPKQQESFNDIIEEIKRISNELKTLNFAIAHVFSHIDIKFNEEADKLAKVGVKLASKLQQTKELTITTAKKANKNH